MQSLDGCDRHVGIPEGCKRVVRHAESLRLVRVVLGERVLQQSEDRAALFQALSRFMDRMLVGRLHFQLFMCGTQLVTNDLLELVGDRAAAGQSESHTVSTTADHESRARAGFVTPVLLPLCTTAILLRAFVTTVNLTMGSLDA